MLEIIDKSYKVNYDSLYKQLNFIKTRKVKINRDMWIKLKNYRAEEGSEASDLYDESVKYLERYGKILDKCVYKPVLGISCCSHLCLDKCGLTTDGKYITVIDFHNCLDYIIHRMCGANVEKIRNMPKYKDISKAILTLNLKELEELGDFAGFIGLDEKFDNYLVKLNTCKNFVKQFYEDVCITVNDLVLKYTFLVKSYFNNKGTVIMGFDLCSSVIRSDSPIDCVVPLDDNYTLTVRSFKGTEYLDYLQTKI